MKQEWEDNKTLQDKPSDELPYVPDDSEPLYYVNEVLGGVHIYPMERLLFFYGGIFSQWAECRIRCSWLDNYIVNCAEQAMMLSKAKFFNDDEIYNEICMTNSPSRQKMLGRMVKGFDQEKWDEVKRDFVENINYAKFSQNGAWGDLLMLTDDLELVEASPTDRIWGIGMSVDNPDLMKRELWGENLLGRAIMNSRDNLGLDKLTWRSREDEKKT